MQQKKPPKHCEHGTVGCKYVGQIHDEEDCWDGFFRHKYICQDCGSVKEAITTANPPSFTPRDCSHCKTKRSMT